MARYKKDNKIKKKFDDLSKEMEPKPKIFIHCVNAFLVGGSICTFGQVIKDIIIFYGVTEQDASTYLPIIMIFIGAFLTGIGVYDNIASFAGAGTLVPITGFSNAMVSPAIEHKNEGYVLGIGSNMFKIAGPVLVFGIGSSVVLGIIYYILLRIGVVV